METRHILKTVFSLLLVVALCFIVTGQEAHIVTEQTIPEMPVYGEDYARIIIEDLGINAPLVWGDDKEILNDLGAICQYPNSVPLGQEGSHLLLGHNYGVLSALASLETGDVIQSIRDGIETDYTVQDISVGTVTQNADNIVDENGRLLIKTNGTEDEMFLYTCYPFDDFGHTDQRLVVYAVAD